MLARVGRRERHAELPVWPPVLATEGPGSASGLHSHHAMHLVLAREGVLRARAKTTAFREMPGVITLPDVPHAIDATGRRVVLVFVDPESDIGARLAASFDGAFSAIDQATRVALLTSLGRSPSYDELLRWGEAACGRLAGGAATARRIHPRVRRLLRTLRTLPADADTSLPALAALAGLSEGRLVHAFRESVGIPLRPYLLWRKLQRAVVAIAFGEPLAAAAASAGFADAAHMTRTFRRMFGVRPSELRRGLDADPRRPAEGSQFVQDGERSDG